MTLESPELHVLKPQGRSLDPPPDRGRLLTPQQVADLIGGVSAAWVRRNLPGEIKIVLGHSTVRYYELDVKIWIVSRRGAA